MTTYKEHQEWWDRFERFPEPWLAPAVTENVPEPVVLGDWYSRGFGPEYGPRYPQRRATPEQVERGVEAWQRIVDKAKQDIQQHQNERRTDVTQSEDERRAGL